MDQVRDGIVDNFGRKVNYLRLAVTDRCNLRCFYCMRDEHMTFQPRRELLSYEEMERLLRILGELGINKLRLTGGEPFVRRGILDFIRRVNGIDGIDQISVTTNGTLTARLIPEFDALNIKSVNLSLDSIDPDRFQAITRRDELANVLHTLNELIAHHIDTKINCVVMQGKNTEDILPLAQLAEKAPITVRFIEEMPFNGEGKHPGKLIWNHIRILDELKTRWPDIQAQPKPPFSTAELYKVPGFEGQIGIIAAYSRTFCGSCNRLRITPQGQLKTCLYDGGVLDLKRLLRNGASDEELRHLFIDRVGNRARNGFEAESTRVDGLVSESMTTIGG